MTVFTREGARWALWAPRRASWWIAVLFAAGSTCFLVGPLPLFLNLVGPATDALVFFVGSVLFTSAAALQWWGSYPERRLHRLDWWSSSAQLVGTLYFNATTFRALATTVGEPSYDRLVWRPDALGSLCFLVSGVLAYVEVAGGLTHRPPATRDGAVAASNLVGCIAFGFSAVGAFVLPATGSEVDVALANSMTAFGALAFLVGSLLLLRQGSEAAAQ
ncbi:MAG: hypothetical protein ACJ76T_15705 [Solirubrobacteraceae bacterium]